MTELRRAAPFLAFALALLVTGCALLPGSPGSADPTGMTELVVAGRTWRAANVGDYRLEVRFSCECAMSGVARIDIDDGQVADAGVNGVPLPPDLWQAFPLTVPAMFDQASLAIERGGTAIGEYDRTTGVPISLTIDPEPRAIDDELMIQIDSFTPVRT
jgi:hypothetical protein